MRQLATLLLAALLPLISPADADPAKTLRIASFNTELSRKGPGLLLRDLQRSKDPQIAAILQTLTEADADILVLQGIDWDYEGRSVIELRNLLAKRIPRYGHIYAARPNTGMQTGRDMDGDGRLGTARDAQGYGRFTGQDGMAILSRLPILRDDVRDLSKLLWQDLPGAKLPTDSDGTPFPSRDALAAQRLSTTGHWVVPILLPSGEPLSVLAFQATPPLFDGPEDRNGLRNQDEIRLWQVLLDGGLGPRPAEPWVIVGGANLDPEKGAGRRAAIADLLRDPRLQDPRPRDNAGHTDTVNWGTSGSMRVDYILPSQALQVVASGLMWPANIPTKDGDMNRPASRHALVWTDLKIP
ncbi:endonuclease/exonuclease/phosphatase family protein [Phaeobacter gallaeciensis]|uniref:endonuclease/exonuclease/phosphatase family protein n=1 Tax=Phaeobacter gallaeciensis TaxID=60890 RepID=UPI000BBBB72F|nr:endonuclease/exonuclease/phosphatase family protein [Phaeobacter gallaeciensis]ATF17160.1 Endonuclease/Exonuclease/phosphatase family protein [Phaeobacter gallaeciensis]ATF21269.1 Endonuclease/Exonuclease/phosphatase family protein [Phaeobacter gallaeciensis]